MKIIVKVAMVGFVIGVIFMAPGIAHSAASIYVDASRPDDSGDGTSWATAKKSIQAGINAVDIGGEVVIRSGTYVQSATIAIDKTLTLKGEMPASKPVVQVINTNYATGLNVNASNVVIQDLSFLQVGTATDSAILSVPKNPPTWPGPTPGTYKHSNITIEAVYLKAVDKAQE